MRNRRQKPGPKPLYPWERWFAAKSFTLVKGRDFRCAVHGMANQIRNRASFVGRGVSLKVGPSSIHVTVR